MWLKEKMLPQIYVEEQNMVENSSAQQGIVPQENGTGFFFIKVKEK